MKTTSKNKKNKEDHKKNEDDPKTIKRKKFQNKTT